MLTRNPQSFSLDSTRWSIPSFEGTAKHGGQRLAYVPNRT